MVTFKLMNLERRLIRISDPKRIAPNDLIQLPENSLLTQSKMDLDLIASFWFCEGEVEFPCSYDTGLRAINALEYFDLEVSAATCKALGMQADGFPPEAFAVAWCMAQGHWQHVSEGYVVFDICDHSSVLKRWSDNAAEFGRLCFGLCQKWNEA